MLSMVGFCEVGTCIKHGQLESVWKAVVIVECLMEENL